MKKCLIIGDYSSLGKNLKMGLEKNSIETYLITNGDGWKNISYDDKKIIKVKTKNIKFLGKKIIGSGRIKYIFDYLFNLKAEIRKQKYDYIIVMNQSFISLNLVPNYFNVDYFPIKFLKNSLNKDGKIYMLACGDDSYYLQAENRYRYFPHSNQKIKDSNYIKYNGVKKCEKILEKIDGIIPICWDYAEAYRVFYKKNQKIKPTIQLPLDLEKIEYKVNLIEDKIIIFHGLNREEFKGTKYIKEAMENIQRKYPDRVEIIVDGKMPLEEYKKILSRANIVIDQCNSYSYGMNALISMAQGKLVLSGNEKECMNELGRDDIPVINIIPSAEDIEKKLEYFIKNPNLITEMGEKSRKFVEEFHECSIVGKEYLKIMN